MTVVYAEETLNQAKADAIPLLIRHYEEIALNKDIIKFNPNWDMYEKYESIGALKIYTAREDGIMIGYFVVSVAPNLHYQDHIFAQNDIIYIAPEHRKGFTGWKLIKFAEEKLKEYGASILMINVKRHKPFDKLLDRLGFENIENVFSKRLI